MKDPNKDHNKLREAKNDVLKRLRRLQFYPPECVHLGGKLLHLAMLSFIAHPFIALLENWNYWTLATRISTIENLIFCIGVVCVASEFIVMPQKTKLLFDVLESEFTLSRANSKSSSNDIYEEKCKLVEEMSMTAYRKVTAADSLTKYLLLSHFIVPIFSLISHSLKPEAVGNLLLPYKFYSPISLSLDVASIYEYMIMFAIQIFYVYYLAIAGIAVQYMQILSLYHIQIEMRLFHLSVKEINLYCDTYLEKTNNERLEHPNIRTGEAALDADLQSMMRQLTMHHQSIFRKVDVVNDDCRLRLFYVSAIMCLEMCSGIFIIVVSTLYNIM